MSLVMYDSIEVSQIPAGAAAVAGYTSGNWPTLASLVRLFPRAHRLSIAVNAAEDADVLDVETGDATIAQAPAWVRRQEARGAHRPGLYAQASNMGALLHAVEAAGITRASVRIWSAHYGAGAHICGPASCRYPGVPACDGTQWTKNALGRNLDESLLLDDFFGTAPAPVPEPKPKPVPAPAEDDDMIMIQPPEAAYPKGQWPGVWLLLSSGKLHHVGPGQDGVSNTAAYTQAGIKGPVTITAAEFAALRAGS